MPDEPPSILPRGTGTRRPLSPNPASPGSAVNIQSVVRKISSVGSESRTIILAISPYRGRTSADHPDLPALARSRVAVILRVYERAASRASRSPRRRLFSASSGVIILVGIRSSFARYPGRIARIGCHRWRRLAAPRRRGTLLMHGEFYHTQKSVGEGLGRLGPQCEFCKKRRRSN